MDSNHGPDIRSIITSLSGRPIAPSGFVAVVSPAIQLIYPDHWRNLNGLLRAAGAAALRPVASGIPEFASRCAESIRARGPGIHILSACPAAIDFLAAEFPVLSPRVLSVSSPMAISSETALRAAGIPDGTAIAISSCSLKKKEESRVPFDMRVIAVSRFFRALADAGINIKDFPESEFDPLSPDDASPGCDISCLVEEALRAQGAWNPLVMKLEGADAARRALSELAAKDRIDQGSTMVIELTFCENGCVREPSL